MSAKPGKKRDASATSSIPTTASAIPSAQRGAEARDDASATTAKIPA